MSREIKFRAWITILQRDDNKLFEQYNSGKEVKVSDGVIKVTSLVNTIEYGYLTAGIQYQVIGFKDNNEIIVINDDLGKIYYFPNGSKDFERRQETETEKCIRVSSEPIKPYLFNFKDDVHDNNE